MLLSYYYYYLFIYFFIFLIIIIVIIAQSNVVVRFAGSIRRDYSTRLHTVAGSRWWAPTTSSTGLKRFEWAIREYSHGKSASGKERCWYRPIPYIMSLQILCAVMPRMTLWTSSWCGCFVPLAKPVVTKNYSTPGDHHIASE